MLVLVLLVIAIAGIAMVGTARRVMAAGRAAREGQAELQRRWGTVSIETAALGNAEKLLDGGKRSLKMDMGGTRFEVTVADEGAKVPVGVLVGEVGKDRAERVVRELVRKRGFLAEVKVEPWTAPAARGEKGKTGAPVKVQSLGQVFPGSGPAEWMTLGQWVTAWGEGGVVARRAPAEVIAARCGTRLSASQVAALKGLLAADAKLKVEDALEKLALTEESREKLEGKLVEASGCYSVWVVADDGRRRWYRFGVKTDGENGSGRVSFVW